MSRPQPFQRPLLQGVFSTASPLRVFALAVGVTLVCAQMVGLAAPVPSQLQYQKGFLVTGNYVVGGIDLTESENPIVDGFSTGTISMGNSVPPNADILAAYLFWETITVTSTPAQAEGVKFRGMDVDVNSLTVQHTSRSISDSIAQCWSSGTPLTMHYFQADVLRFLPMQVDKNDQPTGKRLVNDNDLVAAGLPPHTVSLPVTPDNAVPESAGASLVVVYREDPDPGVTPTEPLRRIVIYNGMHVQASVDEATTLNVQGIYKSASVPSAKVTVIGGSGQPNSRDRILFNNTVVASDPFMLGSASQRGWANPTYDVSSLMNLATNSAQYGETVTVTVDHQPPIGGFDCLTFGGVVFSTAVKDLDHDGLPDGLEDASGGLQDPDGTQLPNLKAMGAGSDQPDLFVEVNAMWAPAGTSYGSAAAPYSPTLTTKTDSVGHHHLPPPADIQVIAHAYELRGIRAHFDIGNVASYHALGVVNHTDWIDDYTSTAADPYLVGNGVGSNVAALARGGELVREVACDATEVGCQFPDFPGTESWKFGLQLDRDRLVGDAGEEISLDPADPDYFDWNAGTHRRRFDPGRFNLFHYVLYAHARGTRRSYPCIRFGFPSDYDANDGTTCVTSNPDFNPLFYNVPTTASGIADLPGLNLLVTVGLWDDFVGRPFTRAGTTFHEMGHNLELWHGGQSAIWGNKSLNTATYIEPNCKPYYLSSMSYLFQVHGLFDDFDEIHLDYSGTEHVGAAETGTVSDAPLYPAAAYQPAWFAPASSTLATSLGVSASARYCNGLTFGVAGLPPVSMARVHAASPGANIDWKGDGNLTLNSLVNQDVNFDGTVTGAPHILNGFNDWANVRLNQLGAAAAGLIPGSGDDLSTELGDLAAELAELANQLGGVAGAEAQQAELYGLAQQLGGLDQNLGGLDQNLGGLVESLGGLVESLGGLDQSLGGLVESLGGLVESLGGLDQNLGGLDQNLGGLGQNLGGQEELSFTHANEMGKSRPYGLTVCRIGADASCSTAAPFTSNYHRIEGRFNAPPFGSFSAYEIQAKRATAPDSSFTTIGTTSTNSFIDTIERANGVDYVYRARGLAADGNSEWSKASQPVTAINDAPVAAADGPVPVTNKGLQPIVIANLLSNDTDDDSPAAFKARRLLSFSPTTTQGGTMSLSSDGTKLLYTAPSRSFEGIDTFTYMADDGLSTETPKVALSSASQATVTLNVTKK